MLKKREVERSLERLLSVMTEGREDKAKELGALARGRKIKSGLGLPQLASLYLTEGKSFSGTAALAGPPAFVRQAGKRRSPGFKDAGNGFDAMRWPEGVCAGRTGGGGARDGGSRILRRTEGG
ncbi:MAG: hypothetical protein LBL45_03700, partial [Treponema sp.]|nr:hypothetical protein [Treponema sp.]